MFSLVVDQMVKGSEQLRYLLGFLTRIIWNSARKLASELVFSGSPNGVRTRVSTLRGQKEGIVASERSRSQGVSFLQVKSAVLDERPGWHPLEWWALSSRGIHQ